ncbi:glycosyltransferase [Williamsia soli]|uniref:glycosyltransferase n=1 Tax=Williamsia soli TaxID=364929 RepID=UPI001F320374|nr:glycosyltransferase [Williamsia soli]
MKSVIERSGVGVGPVLHLDLPWSRESAAQRNGAGEANDKADGRFVVAYMGRLAVEKGVDDLVRAWRFVEIELPNAELRIYGDGSERARLESLASEMKLKKATFHGVYRHEDLERILRDVDLTVHPSRWAENSPYTVRESLQYDVPAVVSDMGGMPELVNDRTGAVYQSSDIVALAKAICDESGVRRARSAGLRSGVAELRVDSSEHVAALADLYGLAMRHAERRRKVVTNGS